MPDFEKLAFAGRRNVQLIETGVRGCKIESVVVYGDRAEVKRAVPVTLAAGENEVIIYDLSSCVTEGSIRVEGKGDAVITDVIYSSKTTQVEEPSPGGTKEAYKAIKEEIEQVEVELKHLGFKEEVLKNQKELLAKFANSISTVHSMKEKNDSLAQLVDRNNVGAVMDFFEKYEAKVADLDARLSSVAQEKVKKREQVAVLQANADKINPNKKVTSTEHCRAVHVGLEAAAGIDAVLYLSYVVTSASWSSAYDARVFTKDKTMKVQYYGLIKQSTEEDWEEAKISLSTAQPAIGGSAPHLPTKIIRFKRPVPQIPRAPPPPGRFMAMAGGHPMAMAGLARRRTASLYDEDSEDEFGQDEFSALNSMALSFDKPKKSKKKRGSWRDSSSSLASYKGLDIAVAEVKSGLFNTTYDIPRATTIPSDDTEHKVTVALVDLSPEFHYSSVPRLSPHSFLQAKAKNTSPYTMLAGPANIFLDNNFIAKSQLSDVSPNEDFTASLGVDQSLRITCKPVEAVHSTRSGLLGGSKAAAITYTHTFLVKNTKVHSVNIHLSEQVPLSTDDRIKVQVIRPDGVRKAGVKVPLTGGHAILNDSNNMEWHVEVEAGAEQQLSLVYSVEHPAQDHVQGLPK